jgi:hypothetical protein
MSMASEADIAKPGESTALVGYVELETPAGKAQPTNPVETRLLPHFPALIHKLAADRNRDDPKYIDFQWRLDYLPYSLAAAYAAYVRYAAATREMVMAHEHQVMKALFVLAPSDTHDACFAIDSFLDAGRRTQNALATILRYATRQNLPNSFNDLMKGLTKDRYSLPEEILKLLSTYWDGVGKQLKAYRDIAQHHALIASNVTLFRSEAGLVGVNMLLPSNPEAKNKSELVWGRPPVHAQRFIREQFRQLLDTTYYLTKLLIEALPGKPGQLVGTYPREPFTLGKQIGGYRPLTEAEIEADVLSVIEVANRRPIPTLVLRSR